MYPVKFTAIPVERIWGGHRLKSQFHVDLEAPIGEYWVVSGHPTATSVVANGELRGKSLVDLTTEFPDEYLGVSPQGRFPLLIKFLEAEQDLSVQVHPGDTYASEHEGDYGKTEAWYVLDCKPTGVVNYGHRFRNRAHYLEAVRNNEVRTYLDFQPIAKEDTVFVPAQTLHALLAGTIVLEVQQTSDVTYRVYDWGRTDGTGRSRELHVDKAADVLLYGESARDSSPIPTREVLLESDTVRHERLLTCPLFSLERLQLNSTTLPIQQGRTGNPDVWIVLDGEAELQYGQGETLAVCAGDAVLVPASLSRYQFTTQTSLTAIRSFY